MARKLLTDLLLSLAYLQGGIVSYPEGVNQGIISVKVARKQKQQRKSPLLLFISAYECLSQKTP